MGKFKYKGSKFQSQGEYEIAKFLDEMDIEYEYEFPIAVVDDGKTKIWYPDFYLTKFQIVVDYFGMYNYNESYRQSVEHKKKIFQECGIQFVPIYELNKGWREYLLKSIHHHLKAKSTKMNKILNQFDSEEDFQDSSKTPSIIKKIKKYFKKEN